MLKSFQRFFNSIVHRLENNASPFLSYVYLFFAILFIRLTLEFFSSNRLFDLDDVLHIGLWFVFIVLAFLIQLKFFSGESFIKVAKLVIVCFSIALTAPIIDLLLTGGVGAKMNYLSLNNFNDILYSYITIGGSSFTRGATLGIRIEIVLLVLASINYVYAKRKNLALAVFSGWSIYTVLFISGAIPYILSHINRFFKLTYMHNDQSTLLFLLTLDLLLLMIPLLVLSRKRVKQFIIYSVRPANLFFVIAFIFGAIWARQNYTANWSLNPTTLFYFLLIPFVFLFLLILRYYFFLSENKTIGNPVFYKVILALLLFIGILLSEHVFFMVVIIWSLIHVKYDSPLYLQKFIFPSCMIDGLLLCSAILFGFVLFGAPMVGFPKLYLVITLVFGSSLSWLHRKFIANQLASKL